MKHARTKNILLALMWGTVFYFVGHAAWAEVISAGLPPFTQAGQDPATFVESLYKYALTIVGAAAVVMIVYGGVKYVASGGNASAKSDALDIIKNAIFGVVLLFGGYIILYTINPNLVNLKNPEVPTAPDIASSTLGGGSSSSGDCVITPSPSSGPAPLTVNFSSDVDPAATFTWTFGDGSPSVSDKTPSHTFQNNGVYPISLTTDLTDPTGQGNDTIHSCTRQLTVGSGGQCQPPTSGPCSVASLQGTCFGNNAQTAGGVCMIESAGNPMAQSGTDKCLDASGVGKPVSFGLFQINISANQIGGLNCPAAFDKPYTGCILRGECGPCHLKNDTASIKLYNDCVTAAMNANDNIAKACQMSGNGSSFSQWGPATLQKCGL